MIVERAVLLRIEHFKQGRSWIAAKIVPDLVYLVQHKDWVRRLRLFQSLNYPPRQGADVGSAMPADLRLVAHPAKRHSNETTVHRFGDGLAERRFADARRSDET